MCIESSVGEGGTNHRNDTVIIQVLLNFNRPTPLRYIEVDGRIGAATKDAIREFQSRVQKLAKPDGRVDPGGGTLSSLQAGLPASGSDGVAWPLILRGIMPAAYPAKIALYATSLRTGMKQRSIDSSLRQAHFLAQLGHESMSLTYEEEIASGAAYEGRADLGNTQPGDGKRFKGRGLMQLTGRSNYTTYGTAIGMNLTDGENPKLVASSATLAVDVACWYWEQHALNQLADADNLHDITLAINGGLNGLADRRAYLRRAKFFFKI